MASLVLVPPVASLLGVNTSVKKASKRRREDLLGGP